MRHRKLALLLLLDVAAAALVLVAVAASAQARPIYGGPFRLPDGPAAARAPQARPSLELAQRAWRRGLARVGCPVLGLSSDPLTETAPSATGIGEVAGWSSPGDCTIHLRRHLRWMGGPELCETILHEAGHVEGYYNPRGPLMSDGTRDTAHSPNPRSIMYPDQWVIRGAGRIAGDRRHRAVRVVTWIGVDRRCLRAYGAHGTN